MIISSSKMDGHGRESEATERSDDDDTLSDDGKEDEDEDGEEEEAGAGANDEERRLLDELEGLEEAEEEEYSGPLLAEEEEEDDEEGEEDDEAQEEEDGREYAVAPQGHADAEVEADDAEPIRENGNDDVVEPGVLDFLTQPPELDVGSPQEQAEFSRELERFFSSRKMDYRPPKFYGENLNLLKLWRTVIRLGAYEYVTANKLWRQVGETFKPPKKCTTVSWSFRIFYEKSLLEYERHKLQGTAYCSAQGGDSHTDAAEALASADQNGSSQPQGRARRDAAMRAMQGWHSQKILDNEVAENSNLKEKGSLIASSREKQPVTGARKKRSFAVPERLSKAPRPVNGARGHTLDDSVMRNDNGNYSHQSYNNAMQRKQSFNQGHAKQVLKSGNHNSAMGADIRVADEGPQADWVKINVHRTGDCFEVYALVPGLLQEELRIQCEPGGLLVIMGEPEQLNNPWGVTPFKKVIKLPAPIDANSTSAVITLHGQLFVRVPYGESHM